MGKALMILVVAAILFTIVRPAVSAATASIERMSAAMARVDAAADAGR